MLVLPLSFVTPEKFLPFLSPAFLKRRMMAPNLWRCWEGYTFDAPTVPTACLDHHRFTVDASSLQTSALFPSNFSLPFSVILTLFSLPSPSSLWFISGCVMCFWAVRTHKGVMEGSLSSSRGWCQEQQGQLLGPFITLSPFLPLLPRPCHERSSQSEVWLKPWGRKISVALKTQTSPIESSSKSLQDVLVPDLGLLQHHLFSDNAIVIKSAFESVCIRPLEPELRKHQLGWHNPYFFHVPLVNSLKVRWLILCLTRKNGSFSQMLLSAESELVHSLRESLNHRLLAGRQTLADSHLWPTMKHHLLWLGEEQLQQWESL